MYSHKGHDDKIEDHGVQHRRDDPYAARFAHDAPDALEKRGLDVPVCPAAL